MKLYYTTSKGKAFQCIFEPYLFEPTGIGHTIYVIGKCTPPDKIRSLKLERINHAEALKQEHFDTPDFDGPALLKTAWVIMFGEQEPVTIRLRFSSRVVTRVKETLWHTSQRIEDTVDGCEMTLQIGDTLEIENWIRGWGPDCEVLEPAHLREKMIGDLRRSARMYGISMQEQTDPDEGDEGLFDTFFGGE